MQVRYSLFTPKACKSDRLTCSFDLERDKRPCLSTCGHQFRLAIQSDGSGFTSITGIEPLNSSPNASERYTPKFFSSSWTESSNVHLTGVDLRRGAEFRSDSRNPARDSFHHIQENRIVWCPSSSLNVSLSIPSLLTHHLCRYSDTIKDFLTAKAYAFAGNTNAALTLYEKVAEEKNGNLAISAAVCVSEFHLHQNPIKALESVDRMVSASSNASQSSQALLHCQRAWCLTFMDQNDVARLELERHVPLLERKDQALALRRLGIVYWNLGGEYRVNKAYSLTCFLQAARLKSDDEAFAYIGKWYLEVPKDIVRAEKCFLRALELSRRNEMAGQALSALYTSTERQHLNVPLWETLTKEREIAPVWALLSLAQYYANQDDERAVEVMLLALGNEPENAIYYVSLGHLYQHFGKYVSAQKTYLRAMELGADAWCLRCEIARLEAMFQLYDDALSRLEPLLARTLPHSVLAPTPEQHSIVSLHLADILYGQSKAFQAQGRYGDAVSNLKRASKVLRDSPETHITRIPILRLLGEIHASAFHLSPKAFDMETGRADAWIAFIAQARHTCDSTLKLLEASEKHSKAQMVDMYLLIATGSWYEAAALCCSSGVPIQALDPSPVRCQPSEIASKAAELQHRSWNFFVKALKIDPKHAFAWNGIGIVHGNAIVKQFCWIRAIQIAFLDAAWANLGFFYANAQQTFLAKEAFLKLQDVNPDHVGMWLGYGLLHRLEKLDSEAQLSIQAFACALSLEFDLDASLGLAFSLIDRAHDLEIDNGLSLRLAEVVFHLHKYIERDPFSAIAWNTLGVALYHSELYQQSAEAFDTASKLLSSDSHSEWIRQIDGNRQAAHLLTGKRMEQTSQLFEIVELANTQPEKALERLKQMRSLFSNASYLGMATVLLLAQAGREDQALGGLEGLLKAAENGGISSRACRNLLGITGLSVVLHQIPAFGALAIQIGRQSKRQIAFWTERATALWEAFEASAYVFERGALAWTDLPTNTRTSALIALKAFHQNHVDAFDIAKRLRLEHTLPERYVAALLALLSSNTNESPSASLKFLRQDPTNATAYLYTAYALVQKGDHSTLERLVAQGRSHAETPEMAFEFNILEQLITSKSSAKKIDGTEKQWQHIRLMSITEPERAIYMYHALCKRTRDPRQQATLLIELASASESAGRVNAAISIWKWLLQRATGLNVLDPESLGAACNLRLAFLYGVRLRKPKVAKGYLKATQDAIPTHLIDAIQRMSG